MLRTAETESFAVRVLRSDELRGDGPFAVSARGRDLALVRTKTGLRAFQGRCPHRGALLGEGELDGTTLVCRNHRWRFSLETGCRQGGAECLETHPVFERNGEVFVEPGAASAGEAPPASGSRCIHDLPGPKGVPLAGNVFQLELPRLHEILEGWAAQYGPMYVYRMGTSPVVVVSTPELNEQVLRARPETYRRKANIEPVFAEMGVAGVFSAEGAAWRPQRRLAMEALSHRHLRGFYPTLRTVAGRLKRRWQAAAADSGRTDILDDLKRFTVDVTTLLTFGHDVNTLEQGDQVIQRQLELVFPAFNRRLFALFPTWRLWRTAADRQLDQALAELRAWLSMLVAKTRARITADPERAEKPSNFLEAMLAARDEAGRPFSDEVLFGNLMTMLLAGEDTTAYTLGWAVHHLCDSAASQQELRRELDAVLGASDVPDDFETANRLAYAGAVANETMRLRPVAPLLLHETKVETLLGDVLLPSGTEVVALLRPPVHDEQNFHDPSSFLPGRWLGAGGGAHEPSAHIPFGSGPRLCPGRSLALLEMKVVLATLFKSFRVEREARTEDVRENFAFTMSPVGLRVRVLPRG